MTFMELADARFSVRHFADKSIEQDKMEVILRAAQIAPTANNQQPQKIYIFESEQALKKLAELTPCVYGAKTVLLFTYDRNADWKNPLETGIHSGIEDVSIAATYVMLQAIELGIYTTWCNFFPNKALEKAFDLPENEEAVLVMPIGYKADDAQPSQMHAVAKRVDEFVRRL